MNRQGCPHCRMMTSGVGLGFSTRLATYADLDFDVDYQPDASPLPSDRAGGNLMIVTVGLRSGYTNSHFSIKGSLRPGILSYGQAYQSSPPRRIPHRRSGGLRTSRHLWLSPAITLSTVILHCALRSEIPPCAIVNLTCRRQAPFRALILTSTGFLGQHFSPTKTGRTRQASFYASS